MATTFQPRVLLNALCISRSGRDFAYRRIGIFGGHVADPDRPGRHGNWLGTNRDRGADGALEKARGHADQIKATPTAQYRDLCWQRRRRRRQS